MFRFSTKMSLDKFGRRSDAFKRRQQQQQFSIPYTKPQLARTQDGNIDMEYLKICNLKLPTDKNDAATKDYIDGQLKDNIDILYKKFHEIHAKYMKDSQVKMGHLQSKNEALENDIKNILNPKISGLEEQWLKKLTVLEKQYKDSQAKINQINSKNELLESDIKNKLIPQVTGLEEQHKMFNITPSYISLGDKRIVRASKAINDFDLVPKKQLIQIIDEKLKEFSSSAAAAAAAGANVKKKAAKT